MANYMDDVEMKIQREVTFGAEEWVDEETCRNVISSKLKELFEHLVDAMEDDLETYNTPYDITEMKLFSIDVSCQVNKWDYKFIARVRDECDCECK